MKITLALGRFRLTHLAIIGAMTEHDSENYQGGGLSYLTKPKTESHSSLTAHYHEPFVIMPRHTNMHGKYIQSNLIGTTFKSPLRSASELATT